jgi:hypothetical protein
MKASGQIGGGINGGIEPAAQRTAEPEGALGGFEQTHKIFSISLPGWVAETMGMMMVKVEPANTVWR